MDPIELITEIRAKEAAKYKAVVAALYPDSPASVANILRKHGYAFEADKIDRALAALGEK